jgi:drug/metabolite transporter (DMT)-like permease
MKLIPIGNAVLLNYTSPIFVALFSPFFLGERIKRSTLYSLSLSVVGILLMSTSQGFKFYGLNLAGVILGVLAGLLYAIFVILSKKVLANLSSYSVAFYSYLTSTVLLFPSIITVEFSFTLRSGLLLFLLGVFNTAFAVTIYLKGLRLIKAQEAAVLTYMEAASAIVFGYFLLGQQLSLSMILGGFLILSAGYIVTLKKD